MHAHRVIEAEQTCTAVVVDVHCGVETVYVTTKCLLVWSGLLCWLFEQAYLFLLLICIVLLVLEYNYRY